jgi:hypothetical protein
MKRVMTFYFNTKNQSALIIPNGEWSRKLYEENLFEISHQIQIMPRICKQEKVLVDEPLF